MFAKNRKFTTLNPFWSKSNPFSGHVTITCLWLWSHEKNMTSPLFNLVGFM